MYSQSRDIVLNETMKAVAHMIHPNDIPVQICDDEDYINSIVFRSEVDLYKKVSVMAVDSFDSKGNLLGRGTLLVSDIQGINGGLKRGSTLRSANPLNKLYVVFAAMDEFLVLEGDRHAEKATVLTEFSICIVTRFPYFPLHFKLVSAISSRPIL